MRLADKVCLIAGTGAGIGQATARLFAKEGARVVVADVDDAAADQTVAEIPGTSGEAVREHVDVTDEGQTQTLPSAVISRFGRIDVLFNNAGIPGVVSAEVTQPDLFDRVMKVNAGRLRALRYLGERADAGHDPDSVRGAIPARIVR